MKIRFIIAALVVVTLLTVGCRTGQPKATTKEAVATSATTTASPVATTLEKFVVVPEKIGVSKLEVKTTPYPNCDGGECTDVDFVIAVKLAGEEEIRTIAVNFSAYSAEKGGSKSAKEILEGKSIHAALTSVDSKKVNVTLAGKEITKIVVASEWSGAVFVPETVLWEK